MRVRIRCRNERFKKFAFLLFLGTVVLSLTAATANLAGAANATGAQPADATTHPIQYWIGCAPSMVTSANLNYFKQQGFTAVVVVVPDSQTYQTQLTTIKSNNMLPIIDIEMPIWDGGQLQSTPISSFAGYFQSLTNAGWQYVASEGGRTGDLAYLQNYFRGYVNFNCDQCGLWKGGYPVYTNSFTAANSWESYYPSEWPYIQNGSRQAAALGIQNGILAGTWANNGGDNQIYANSVSGSGTPSYLSMLNWSYANGIGFTSFHVWCGDNPQGLSQYTSLGFDKIVAAMQVYYPATTSASLGSGNLGTQLTLTASSTTPTANQNFTINGTLSASSGGIGNATITLQRSTNNVTYTNVTTNQTGVDGSYQFSKNESAAGTYYYRTAYDGNDTYTNATSKVVTVTVNAATTPLTVTAIDPANNATDVSVTKTINVTFNKTIQQGANYTNITLKKGTVTVNATTTIAGHTLTIKPNAALAYSTNYAVFISKDGVKNGTQTLASNFTSHFTTVAALAKGSTLNATAPSTANVKANFTVKGRLTAGGTNLTGQSVTLYRWNGAAWVSTGKKATTNTTGWYALSRNETAAGKYSYHMAYAGNATYANATSATFNVTVKYPTSLTAVAPATASVGTNFTVTGRLLNGTTSLTGQNVTLQRSLDNKTWVTVTGKTNTTNATGGYTLTTKEPTAGTYYYRGYYTGNATYAAATSKGVKVVVS